MCGIFTLELAEMFSIPEASARSYGRHICRPFRVRKIGKRWLYEAVPSISAVKSQKLKGYGSPLKPCRKCGAVHDVSASKSQWRRNLCKPCRSEEDARDRKERRSQHLAAAARHRAKAKAAGKYSTPEHLAKARDRRARRRAIMHGAWYADQYLRGIKPTRAKRCFYCAAPLRGKYHIDHLIPLAKGGKHVDGNIVIACPACNLRKGAKREADFLEAIGGGQLSLVMQ